MQLTPEMYNQLRGLQKQTKDLRHELRDLRRMSQTQAHSIKESVHDTFVKIRLVVILLTYPNSTRTYTTIKTNIQLQV